VSFDPRADKDSIGREFESESEKVRSVEHQLTAKITEIGIDGKLVLSFSSPLQTLEKEEITKESLRIEIISVSEDIELPEIELTWETESIETKSIHLQLNIADPELITANRGYQVVLEFTNPE